MYSTQIREIANQKIYEYRHFLSSEGNMDK